MTADEWLKKITHEEDPNEVIIMENGRAYYTLHCVQMYGKKRVEDAHPKIRQRSYEEGRASQGDVNNDLLNEKFQEGKTRGREEERKKHPRLFEQGKEEGRKLGLEEGKQIGMKQAREQMRQEIIAKEEK